MNLQIKLALNNTGNEGIRSHVSVKSFQDLLKEMYMRQNKNTIIIHGINE